MVVSDNTIYKNKIMNKLVSIADVITLINNLDVTTNNPDGLRNVNLFSRIKIPDVQLETKNYICFDFNSRTSSTNNTLKNVSFSVWIICHEDEITTDGGNRHDVLAGVIIDAFNWSNFLGFELELVSDTESMLKDVFCVRTLQFKNATPNSLQNKMVRNDE